MLFVFFGLRFKQYLLFKAGLSRVQLRTRSVQPFQSLSCFWIILLRPLYSRYAGTPFVELFSELTSLDLDRALRILGGYAIITYTSFKPNLYTTYQGTCRIKKSIGITGIVYNHSYSEFWRRCRDAMTDDGEQENGSGYKNSTAYEPAQIN